MRNSAVKNQKRKIIEYLDEDEALVVAPVSVLRHISHLYRTLAVDAEAEHRQHWVDIADLFDDWINQTVME